MADDGRVVTAKLPDDLVGLVMVAEDDEFVAQLLAACRDVAGQVVGLGLGVAVGEGGLPEHDEL